MRTPEIFDEIRPYDAEELKDVFKILENDAEFREVVKSVMPGADVDQLFAQLNTCKNSLEVQKMFFYPLLKQLAANCSDGLSIDCSKIESKDNQHTFITNHRDIVIDSAFLSILLIESGFPTTVEIAIGDNLLIKPWIKHLVRVNKSFIVQRSLPVRQMLASSARLSQYMHYAIAEKKENIWIAQREGRAKDSNDRTQEALLKMMAMGGEGSLKERLIQLHLTPMAISYEYDPCDWLKAQEFQQKRDIPGFKKSKQDDLDNMQTGIYGKKGRIVYRAAGCIDSWLESLPEDMGKAEFFAATAHKIDEEIHKAYTIYPNNYAALDLLNGSDEYLIESRTDDNTPGYTSEEKAAFESYINGQLAKVYIENPDMEFLKERILTMYANPLVNQLAALKAEPSGN